MKVETIKKELEAKPHLLKFFKDVLKLKPSTEDLRKATSFLQGGHYGTNNCICK